MKLNLREKAIVLRKKGLSYSEILKEIPVAKSTLSLWLRSVNLAKKQKQRLTEKKLFAMRRGWETRRQQRVDSLQIIKQQAQKEIENISPKELFLIGIALYWAEGSKAKEHNVSQGVIFSNSDSQMVKIFLKWLKDAAIITKERIAFEIYVHESSRSRLTDIKNYWASETGFPIAKFDKIYFKKDKIKTNRKNKGNIYFGLLRVKIKKSTDLNRKISAWIEVIVNKCGVV